jgi:aldehyde dehydrogenase (NAD+)
MIELHQCARLLTGEKDMRHQDVLAACGLSEAELTGGTQSVRTPIDGAEVAQLKTHCAAEVEEMIARGAEAFQQWRKVPAPRRGELVRLIGEELRAEKDNLGRLVTLECGKIYQEGLGEVQEMIDICDFAVGLSRQLYGLTIASERPGHAMRETWHPMGVCGIITAFNFPVAPWCWNAALALVCGNPIIWKPSEKTPLTALATQKICERAMARFGDAPDGLIQTIVGEREAGELLAKSRSVAIVSATGSTRMGHAVSTALAERFGRCILELGGNNAMIVAPSADLEMALRAIVFSAVGTAGQRCTTLRRLIVHESIYDALIPRLKDAYADLPIGDPLAQGTLVGPLIDEGALIGMERALERTCDRRDAGPDRDRLPRDLRADPLCDEVRYARRRHRPSERCSAGSQFLHLLHRCAGDRGIPLGHRLRLRHRECQHRPVRRRDRRCLRWREGHRRRPRERIGRLEGLHAPPDQHHQLFARTAACAGHQVRR